MKYSIMFEEIQNEPAKFSTNSVKRRTFIRINFKVCTKYIGTNSYTELPKEKKKKKKNNEKVDCKRCEIFYE